MKWLLKDPAYGDMIRAKVGSIYHYGVFVSEDEIIQFGLAPAGRPTLTDAEVAVCTSDIDAFLCGSFLEVAELDRKEQKKRRAPADTVAYARGRIGEHGYNILYNNCEHFAYECVMGERYSAQTEDVRAMFHSLPIVDVYYAKIPEGIKVRSVVPRERENEIAACSNERVKLEKYCVWQLLEYALERSFGFKLKKLTFTKNEHGKWTCPACYFSLSHSKGVVAVAVSRAPVGVDVERCENERHEAFADRILTEREREEYNTLPQSEKGRYIMQKWTQKESLFKASDDSSFSPHTWQTDPSRLYTEQITLGDDTYFLSVATNTPERIRKHGNITLK